MKAKLRIFAALILAVAGVSVGGAQTQTQTWTTWSGSNVDVSGFVGTSESNSTQFYLYNVGTGKFIIQGGGWGTEAMLTLPDYGMPFTMYDYTIPSGTYNGDEVRVIASGVHTQADAFLLGCNEEGWTAGTGASSSQTMGGILDARPASSFNYGGTRSYKRSWTLERVESSENTSTYTYYLKETITRSSGSPTTETLYLGSNWGTNTGTKGTDRTAYATEDEFNSHSDADKAYYQWRLVSETQFEAVQSETSPNAYGGLNANVTYLLKDPYMSRNQMAFNTWKVSNGSTTTFGTEGRADWTINRNNNTTATLSDNSFTEVDASTHTNFNNGGGAITYLWNESWDTPVFRKLQAGDSYWNSYTREGDAQAYHMNNGRFEMATLEGVGSAYQTITVPKAGTYQLQVMGYSSNASSPGYLFVSDADGGNVHKVQLPELQDKSIKLYSQGSAHGNGGSYWTNISPVPDWNNAAKHLDDNADAYTVSLIFTASADNQQFRVGVMKSDAHKSYQVFDANYNGTAYKFYFDDAYAAVDNFQMHYLGTTAPFILNDNSVTGSYITGAELTNRTVYLRRQPKRNMWQSIILPVSISTNVFQQAFGEDAKLGELEGVGKAAANSPTSIDFKSVTITPDKNAIEAGKYYLIYVTRAPEHIEFSVDNVTYSGEYYRLGRLSMSGISTLSPSNTIANSRWSPKDGDSRTPFTTGDLKAAGTYIKTPKELTSNYVPEGAYFVQNGDMHYVKSNSRVYGFQWWITVSDAAAKGAAKNGFTFSFFNPTDDNTVTYISGVSIDRKPKGQDNAVYNLAGQRVADEASALSSLPKGIYITGGKKIFKR